MYVGTNNVNKAYYGTTVVFPSVLDLMVLGMHSDGVNPLGIRVYQESNFNNLNHNLPTPILAEGNNSVYMVALSTDKKYCATVIGSSTGTDQELCIQNANGFSEISSYGSCPTTGNNLYNYCAFSSSLFAIVSQSGTQPELNVYNFPAMTSNHTVTTGNGNGYSCAFSPDGSLLAVGYDNSNGPLVVYHTSGWSTVSITGGQPTGVRWINTLEFSPDGTMLAVGGNTASTGQILTVYDTTTWAKKSIPAQPLQSGSPNGNVLQVSWSPDSTKLLVGNDGQGADGITASSQVFNSTTWAATNLKASNNTTPLQGWGYNAWSKDGNWLACTDTETTHSQNALAVFSSSNYNYASRSSVPNDIPLGQIVNWVAFS